MLKTCKFNVRRAKIATFGPIRNFFRKLSISTVLEYSGDQLRTNYILKKFL